MSDLGLGTQYPIIQAPMNWVTDAKLVAAVSNAGGLGVLGTNAGQREVTPNPKQVETRMTAEIQKTKALTTKPFGINILTPGDGRALATSPYTMAMLKAAFAEGIRHFIVVGQAHQETFDLIKQHHGMVIFRPLTPSVQEAQLAERLGADIIVATGHDEGGVLPNREAGTFTVVPEFVDAVSVPVFAAGGINDRRAVKAVQALGAVGVYVGTRFLATEEAPVADNVKQLIVDTPSQDTVMVSGNQRAIATPQAQVYAKTYAQTHDTSASNRQIGRDGGLRESMLLGHLDHGIVTVNNGIGTIKQIQSVHEIIESFFE